MEERLKIAVFVDFDNIEIGVKTTLGVAFDIGTILEAIKERGEVVTKVAYGDWTRAGDYSRLLTQHAIKMVQRNLTPGGDKNGADINLALDALEMALTHDHINAYVIVGGDSDFLSLVEKLKQYDKTVLIVGGRAFTSVILQRNCHEFIAYENLINVGQSRRQPERGRPAAQAPTVIGHAFPLVRRALKVLSEREVTPQLGLLKSTLLQLDSTFSEKSYGASSFRDFAEKLAQAGLLRLNQAGRNLLVEIKESDTEEAAELPAPPAPARHAPHGHGQQQPHAQPQHPHVDEAPARQAPEAAPQPPGATMPAGEALAAQQAEAISIMKRVIENAASPLRWPMYVRNVKQLMRAGEPGFDERRYGFGGILDLLRGGQREGFLRLERDRQGVLRVFPGTSLERAAAPAQGGGPEAAAALRGAEEPPFVAAEPVDGNRFVGGDLPAGEQEPVEAVSATEVAAGEPARADTDAEVVDVEPAEAIEAEGTVEVEASEPVEVMDSEEGPQPAPTRRPRSRRPRATARKTTAASKKKTTPASRTRARKARTKDVE
jgi:uncharacterized LabA/DUF88 family protein